MSWFSVVADVFGIITFGCAVYVTVVLLRNRKKIKENAKRLLADNRVRHAVLMIDVVSTSREDDVKLYIRGNEELNKLFPADKESDWFFCVNNKKRNNVQEKYLTQIYSDILDKKRSMAGVASVHLFLNATVEVAAMTGLLFANSQPVYLYKSLGGINYVPWGLLNRNQEVASRVVEILQEATPPLVQ